MKKIFSLIIIFSLYTQSLVTPGTFRMSFTSAKANESVLKEVSDSCSGNDGCAYDYDGEGSTTGDQWRIAYEQILISTMAFLTVAKISQCIGIKAKWTGPNLTAKKKIKCLGFGEAVEIGTMVALIIAEIIQMVMVTTKVKKELDESNHKDILRGALNDEDKKSGKNDYTIKITGDLGRLKKQCENEEANGVEQSEECVDNEQLGPLLALRRILETQVLAAKIKLGIYGFALTALIIATIADVVAALKAIAMDAAEVAKSTAVCAAADTASAACVVGAGCVALPCVAACKPFLNTCGKFYILNEMKKKIPAASCFDGVALSPLNIACGVASKSQKTACAEFEQVASETAEIVIDTAGVSIGDETSKCSLIGFTPFGKNKPKSEFKTLEKFIGLFANQAHAKRFGESGIDSSQVGRVVLSLAGSFLGGLAGYFAFSKVLEAAQDAWAFSNEKRAVLHGVQSLLVTGNMVWTGLLIKRLNTEIGEIDYYTSEIDAALSSGTSLSTGRMVLENEIDKSFEDQFLQEFNETFAKEKSPCVQAPDGKGGCIKISPLINDVISGLDLDGIVGENSSNVGKFSDALANKNKLDKNALKLGQKIAAAKGPLEKIKNKLMEEYNKERMRQGKKPYEFEKYTGDLLQTIKDKFFEAVGKDANASVGSITDKKEKSEKVLENINKKVGVRAKKDNSSSNNPSGFSIDFGSHKASEKGVFSEKSINSVNTDKYSLTDADVNKSKNKNLFKLITIRYFKSAYPGLMESAK